MLEKDHCSINWMGNCYGWETWCHMNYHISFISWFNRHIHNMKIINKMDNKFFGLKKKIISILLIAYVFTKEFMLIVHSICSALSCRLSAQFFPQLPHGCFACCCFNMSFIHIPLLRSKTLPAVCADLVNPWISRNISAYFWSCDVFWDLRETAYYPVIILKNKGCFLPVTADTVRIRLTWKFCKLYKV